MFHSVILFSQAPLACESRALLSVLFTSKCFYFYVNRQILWLLSIALQARTQDFEKGGSEYRVAIRPRRGRVWEGMCPLTCEVRCFYTMDLECQIFIQIYREKITETINLSSPFFLDASVKTFYKHYLYQFQSHS